VNRLKKSSLLKIIVRRIDIFWKILSVAGAVAFFSSFVVRNRLISFQNKEVDDDDDD
jgi:hypothetical protein